ncbi:hypothetical protein RI367_002694 [Sorochytrium milnesiophthora]
MSAYAAVHDAPLTIASTYSIRPLKQFDYPFTIEPTIIHNSDAYLAALERTRQEAEQRRLRIATRKQEREQQRIEEEASKEAEAQARRRGSQASIGSENTVATTSTATAQEANSLPRDHQGGGGASATGINFLDFEQGLPPPNPWDAPSTLNDDLAQLNDVMGGSGIKSQVATFNNRSSSTGVAAYPPQAPQQQQQRPQQPNGTGRPAVHMPSPTTYANRPAVPSPGTPPHVPPRPDTYQQHATPPLMPKPTTMRPQAPPPSYTSQPATAAPYRSVTAPPLYPQAGTPTHMGSPLVRPTKPAPPVPRPSYMTPSSGGRPQPAIPMGMPAAHQAVYLDILAMGFPQSVIETAMRLFGDDRKKIADFCLIASPTFPIVTTMELTQAYRLFDSDKNLEQFAKYLGAYAKLKEMGYSGDKIGEALFVNGFDEMKALDMLMR